MNVKTVRLADVCSIKYGKDHKKLCDGTIPAFGSGGVMRYVNQAISEKPSVLIPRKGSLSNLFYVEEPFWTVDTLFWTDIYTDKIIPRYFFYVLKQKNLSSYNEGSAVPSLTVKTLNDITLDLPDLHTQKTVVNFLSNFDKKINLNNRINDYLVN